ncbi:hypothetical protein KI688_010470 [Linnemannia hyalina]|uniref:Uncharacterized protein n=1 Tax=Linnemannia hyalina TaxID=64524 RepID=A0A9P8BVV7_9FUNG|nr:hypothetical protein KI688_010470 [Linnemannia hyalina]
MARMDQLSEAIEQNKHNNTHTDDSTLVITKPRPTYIVPTKSLLAIYPVIALQKDFFRAKLDPADKFIDMSDFHFMEGMDYDAHPLLDVQQKGLRLNDDKRFAEKELAKIQTRLAHLTRPLDTLALMAAKDNTENIWKDRAVALASTIRYLADPTPKPAAVTLADVAERKAALDAINPVFPVKKKHDKPPNKDQDKHDSTKSGSSNDKSKGKPKNNKDHGPGNNNNNNNNSSSSSSSKNGNSGSTGRKSDGSNSGVAENGDGQGSGGGEKTHQLK